MHWIVQGVCNVMADLCFFLSFVSLQFKSSLMLVHRVLAANH